MLADPVGVALLVVLDTLAPAERLAFVLHDMFALPCEEIAPLVGRSVAATRQLASRARRRIRTAAPVPDGDRARQSELAGARTTGRWFAEPPPWPDRRLPSRAWPRSPNGIQVWAGST
jgi:hypothetical protein